MANINMCMTDFESSSSTTTNQPKDKGLLVDENSYSNHLNMQYDDMSGMSLKKLQFILLQKLH